MTKTTHNTSVTTTLTEALHTLDTVQSHQIDFNHQQDGSIIIHIMPQGKTKIQTLQEAITAGVNSGISKKSFDEIIEEARTRVQKESV